MLSVIEEYTPALMSRPFGKRIMSPVFGQGSVHLWHQVLI